MKIFLFFFWKAIKIAGSAQKNNVGRVSGNTGIFLGLIQRCPTEIVFSVDSVRRFRVAQY